jgi:trimeric autotransporter adhesin
MKRFLCNLMFVFSALGAFAAVPADTNWQSGFVLPPGTDGEVYAVTAIGTNVYVGGTFETAGGVIAKSIARWDGSNWFALGSGINGTVYALANDGTNVYVGGKFDRAGGTSVQNLARWNGTTWEAIGDVTGSDGFSFEAPTFGAQGPRVITLVVSTNRGLLVGGNFRQAGTVAATNIAAWDGVNWTAFGSGMGNYGGQVHAIAEFRGSVYAGGVFLSAGEAAITNIARWNGSNWVHVGAGLIGPRPSGWISQFNFAGVVNTLAVQGSKLYAGGQLTHSGRARMMNFAYTTGTAWKGVKRGIGLTNGIESVESIVVRGKEMFVAGNFQRAGGAVSPNITRGTGKKWQSLGTGVGGPVKSVALSGTNVYVGGLFGIAGGVSAAYVAYWDGASNVWRALGEGQGNTLIEMATTLAASSDMIFAAGSIQTAGTNFAHNVAAWTGTNWLVIDPGLTGLPTTSAYAASNFYVAGNFVIESVNATNIAGWTGSNWFALPPLMDANTNPAQITLITARSNELFVAGNFVSAGGLPMTNVALWNGSNWVALGDAPSVLPLSGALPMVADANYVYALHGETNNVGGVDEVVYRWDGTNWALIGAPNGAGHVRSLAAFGGYLYAASVFYQTGDTDTTKMDRWTGTKWESVNWPFGQLGYVPLMAATDRYIYAGGPWDYTASSSPGIARFDGANWSPLGSGLIDTDGFGAVTTMAASGRRLAVAGFFKTAGDKPSYRFAIWNEPE